MDSRTMEMAEVYRRADRLHSAAEVDAAVARMGRQISARLEQSNPLVLCVMTGGVVFAGRLLTHLEFPLQVDYIHATRYGDATRGGRLEWVARPRIPLAGRTVLLLDDILDEGFTLAALVEDLRRDGAQEVLSAVLVEKLHERKAPGIEADFCGLRVADRYLFGSGMDYKGYWRNAPGICAVEGL